MSTGTKWPTFVHVMWVSLCDLNLYIWPFFFICVFSMWLGFVCDLDLFVIWVCLCDLFFCDLGLCMWHGFGYVTWVWLSDLGLDMWSGFGYVTWVWICDLGLDIKRSGVHRLFVQPFNMTFAEWLVSLFHIFVSFGIDRMLVTFSFFIRFTIEWCLDCLSWEILSELNKNVVSLSIWYTAVI